MPTHHEHFEENLAHWERRAGDLTTYGFNVSDARDLTMTVGSRTEIFLKTAVLPHTSPRKDFNGCINELESLGVSELDRDTLHDLRRLYNSGKHNPQWIPSLLDLQRVMPRISETFRRLVKNNVGLLNVEIQKRHHQVFWVATWDDFIGGDSEVQIIAPARGAYPPTLDNVYVDILRWDQIKDTLTTLGTLRPGEGLIPAEVLESFHEDSDFHQAVVFEGSFRDLIAVLASHERREDLIPGLRREDDLRAMMQAFVLAALDCAPQSASSSSTEDLAATISRRAIEAYAVPESYGLLDAQSAHFARMICALPESKRTQVNGPIWITKDEFGVQTSSALSKHPRLPVLINSEGTFLIQFPS